MLQVEAQIRERCCLYFHLIVSNLYNKHFACLSTTADGKLSHFQIKLELLGATNLGSCALEEVSNGVLCRSRQLSVGLRSIKRKNLSD